MPAPVDPVALCAELIRCASVTPQEAGALDLLERVLRPAGFDCTRVDRGEVKNLFARWGAKGHVRSFGFNGHVDVVPPGDAAAWSDDPFSGVTRDGFLWGRGATDMKSGVAAFVAAAVDLVTHTPPDGAVILAITGDEEGPALDGTRALLDWMNDTGETMNACLVGEPTSQAALGDMVKIGRRGSLNARFAATGVQGHAAYPHRARNPVAALARLFERLARSPLDQGSAHFDPSTLALTTFDTGNGATNVIPARCTGGLNIRFNDLHSGADLEKMLRSEARAISAETGVDIDIDITVSGDSFLTLPGPLSDLVSDAIFAQTGLRPELSTSGGTSDARFVKDHCPVIECGLVNKTMHEVDERVEIAQITGLAAIYRQILGGYFA